jgi:tight adherence protein C
MNEIAYLLISTLVAVSAFAATMGLRVQITTRRLALANAAPAAPAIPTARSVVLAQSWRERILKPTLRALHGAGRMLTPNRNVEQLQQQLMLAGLLDSMTIIDFLGMRILAGGGVGALVFSFTILSKPWPSAMLFAVAGFAIGLYLPNFWLKSQIGKRQKAITRALPDALDRMSICVDAGLGFEAAIQKVAIQGKNELAVELRRVMGEIRLGVARVDALHHLVDRTGVPDIASFVAVLVQADQLGLAIRDVLHTQSVQMRVRRRQRAEEEAQKAPIKMLIPLVLFIFPTVFAVILGPAIPRILSAFQ